MVGTPGERTRHGPVAVRRYGESLERYPIDTARLRGVADTVLEKSDWSARTKAGRALGIAVHRSFVSYVATVVEVEVSEGRVSVPRLDVAVLVTASEAYWCAINSRGSNAQPSKPHWAPGPWNQS